MEQNRGIGWSPLVKGTYTETDGLITAILTHGDINADDPTDQLQPYDTIDPNDLADKDMPPNKPMSLQISGDSIAWGPITMIRDKYADKFTSSVFNGMITHDDDDLPAKLTVGTDKIWTMSVQTGPEQYTDFIKGVYMMTGTVSAKVFITHGNLDLIDPPNPVAPPDWEYVDEDMSALAKAEFLPSEGQTLTATGITDTSYKMSIYGTLRTFTRD